MLKAALAAARRAGDLIARRFRLPKQAEVKADSSLVTQTDLESEALIKGLLQKKFPAHNMVSEEAGGSGGGSPYTWVIDPLDGTNNFIRGVPLCAVEIGLLKNGEPHIGVSNLPVLRDMLWAARGSGAYCAAGRVQVSNVQGLDQAYLSFGNIKHFGRAGLLERLCLLAATCRQARGIGDAWSFHLLARGQIDVFVDAKTSLWDIAALAAIVAEAGGVITDLEGRPITERSTSVLAANPHLHPQVLRCFQT